MKTFCSLVLGIFVGAINSTQGQGWIDFRNFLTRSTLDVPFFDDQGRLLDATNYLEPVPDEERGSG